MTPIVSSHAYKYDRNQEDREDIGRMIKEINHKYVPLVVDWQCTSLQLPTHFVFTSSTRIMDIREILLLDVMKGDKILYNKPFILLFGEHNVCPRGHETIGSVYTRSKSGDNHLYCIALDFYPSNISL